MQKKPLARWLLLSAMLLIPLLILTSQQFTPEVRGKSQARPLSNELTPEQDQAQELTLLDARVQNYTHSQRTEVMTINPVLAQQYTAASSDCATANCYQVDIYNFDTDTAVTSIVNLDTNQVLDVLEVVGVNPGLNKRLADLALEIAFNAPEVIEILGFQPTTADMAPVDANLINSSCEANHLCAGPTFELGDRVLWAVVDLTEEKLAGIEWTYIDLNTPPPQPSLSNGCPAPGTVDRDGWQLEYAVSGSDGLRVFDATYNGIPVLTSVKLVEWHADYGGTGFVDSVGCNPSGGFPIYPFGNTEVLDLLNTNNEVEGFEVVQDFRMSNWGAGCNYRYEQRIRFYEDGRFRVVSGAYGKGCGDNSLYRPVIRIDIAIDGDDNDSFARWDGNNWQTLTTEDYLTPYDDGTHGPHLSNSDGYTWRVLDAAGSGYYIEQDVGQFDGRGDEPFMYPTLHHANEGDTDLGALGSCCNDDHVQGPEQYVNGEAIDNANIVLWYLSQMDTDVTPGDYYCWTITGDPNPETYPCFGGPMFTPINQPQPAVAGFSHNAPVGLGDPVAFDNTSIGAPPMMYSWDFGDGNTSTEKNPDHIYGDTGVYTVTLTAQNNFATSVYVDTVSIGIPAEAAFNASVTTMPLGTAINFSNTSTGDANITYLWDFGNGDTSTEANPTYTYPAGGQFDVTLTASNPYGQSHISQRLVVETSLSTSTMLVSAPTIERNDLMDYTIILHNDAAAATSIQFSNDIPEGTIYVVDTAYASHGITPNIQSETITWVGQVQPGTPVILGFSLQKVQGDHDIRNIALLTADGADTALVATSYFKPNYRVTLNEGNQYSTMATVDVHMQWDETDNITHYQLSNDANFVTENSSWLAVDSEQPVHNAWILDTMDDLRWPRTVYVRFQDADGNVHEPIHDTILYDGQRPTIETLTVSDTAVTVTAVDTNSGLETIQISHTPTFADATTYLVTSDTMTLPWTLDDSGRLFIRAVDRAGNTSLIISNDNKLYLPYVAE